MALVFSGDPIASNFIDRGMNVQFAAGSDSEQQTKGGLMVGWRDGVASSVGPNV